MAVTLRQGLARGSGARRWRCALRKGMPEGGAAPQLPAELGALWQGRDCSWSLELGLGMIPGISAAPGLDSLWRVGSISGMPSRRKRPWSLFEEAEVGAVAPRVLRDRGLAGSPRSWERLQNRRRTTGPGLTGGGNPGSRHLLEAPGRERAAENAGGRLRASGGSEHPPRPSISRPQGEDRWPGSRSGPPRRGPPHPPPAPARLHPLPRPPLTSALRRRMRLREGGRSRGPATALREPPGPAPPAGAVLRASPHPGKHGGCLAPPLSATQPCPQTTPGSDAPTIIYIY